MSNKWLFFPWDMTKNIGLASRGMVHQNSAATLEQNITSEPRSTISSSSNMDYSEYNQSDYDQVENYTYDQYIDAVIDFIILPKHYEYAIMLFGVIILFVGLLGNFLVCYVVYKNFLMQTVTNIFIVNLAIADFCVLLFCLPPTILWDVTETWFFGNISCKLILYFQVSR